MNDSVASDSLPSKPSYFGITRENVQAIRNFTGEGIMSIGKALSQAGGDPLLAVGLLKYTGCLVNYKNGDGAARTLAMAESWATELKIVDGIIGYKSKDLELDTPAP